MNPEKVNVESIIKNDIESQDIKFTNTFINDKDRKSDILDNDCFVCFVSCFGGCGFIALLITLVGGWITWAILSIIALSNTSNDEIKDKCSESNLWILLLVSVIFGFINNLTINIKDNENDNEKNKTNIFNLVSSIGLIIWSGIELFSSCAVKNLHDTRIYLLVEIYFWFGIAIFGLIACCLPCLFCVSSVSKK